MNGKLTQLAPATAANGTNRPMIGGNFETAAGILIKYYLKIVSRTRINSTFET